jgi:hypothetical protein
VISSIKTPPHFSFQKESRNLDPLTDAIIISSFDTNQHCNTTRNINNFNSLSKKYKTFVSPGVGDYQIEKVDTKNKSPICTIGHGRRFEKVSSMQRYKMSLPIGYQSNIREDPQAPKRKYGVIGSEKRFGDGGRNMPGPGEYNT